MFQLEIVDVASALSIDDVEARIAIEVAFILQAARVQQVIPAQAQDEVLADALLDIGFQVSLVELMLFLRSSR